MMDFNQDSGLNYPEKIDHPHLGPGLRRMGGYEKNTAPARALADRVVGLPRPCPLNKPRSKNLPTCLIVRSVVSP